ncbi:MAG: glycosyltransferase [Fretibacterium sp.]|nr:glycosyltransferase [Fretibacterium sp.]
MNPLISVIIPAYNAEKSLERCLDSVLAQDYEEIELLVVNDGSTDGTRDILTRYAKLPTVTCIEQENSGPGKSRCVGFQASRGDFISFVDADDYIAPNMLSSLYERLKAAEADVASCGWYRIVGDEIYPRMMPAINGASSGTGIEAVDWIILREKQFALWNKLFRRNLFQSIDFDEISSFRMGEDVLFLFSLFFRAEKVVLVDKALYFYVTDNPQSLTNAPSPNAPRERLRIFERVFQCCLAQPHEVWKHSLYDFYFDGLMYVLRICMKLRPSSKEEERELRLFLDETKKKILSFPLGHMTKEQRAKTRAHLNVFLIKAGLFEKAYALWDKTGPFFRRIIKKMI